MARIKVSPEEGAAIYHCMTRTVNGERLLDDVAKEILRRQLWQVADYCGVRIVTYAILSNHFHVLVEVPEREVVGDAELLRRFRVLYPHPTKYQQARHEVIAKQLSTGGNEAEVWRRQQLALMGDVSQFMKLVKQRFSIWYNRSHRRYGTLWAERFKSVLVEGRGRVLTAMAAYIDLNAVRAGLVEDPKDYRFCGYAEAVAGGVAARTGVSRAVEGVGWDSVQAAYRTTLYGIGAGPRENGGGLPAAELENVLNSGGKLPVATALRCRVRYFTDGAVLGSKAFVSKQLEEYRRRTGRRKRTEPRPMPGIVDWEGISTLRGFRRASFGCDPERVR
jgi:putative transposase